MLWKITLPSNNSYFLSREPKNYEELLRTIHAKYDVENYGPFSLKYIDAEDEFINLCTAEDFDTAILSAKTENLRISQVFVIPNSSVKISKNYLKTDIPTSSENRLKNTVPYSKSQNQRHRSRSIYPAGNPAQISYKKPYMTKLPLINEAQILHKGQITFKKFGKLKRSSSCPLNDRFSECYYSSRYLDKNVNVSTQDLKSICQKFIEKFTDEKINKQVKEEIKDIIPVLMDLLEEAWKANVQKGPTQKIKAEPFKVCCQCKLPAKNMNYICNGCFQRNDFTSKTKIDPLFGNRIYKSYKSLDPNELFANAERISRMEAKKVNDSIFSRHIPLRRTASRKMRENYKVSVLKITPDGLEEVGPDEQYKIRFELQNSGDVKWPDNMRLVCTNGRNKGKEKILPSLDPGRKIKVELALKAPKVFGRYLSQWRLTYGHGKKHMSFGESLFEEIQVSDGVIGNDPLSEIVRKNRKSLTMDPSFGRQEQESCSERKESLASEDSWTTASDINENQVPTKITCPEDRMKCAKFLNEVFPGDLQEKINFIKKFLEEVTIFDVVEKYLIIRGKNTVQT